MRTQSSAATVASLLLSTSLAGASLLFACSSSDDARTRSDDATDSGVKPLSDGGFSGEAGEDTPDGGKTETPAYDFEVECTVEPCATQIAARGGAHVCALLSDRSVRCWGANGTGQLGLGGAPGAVSEYDATPRGVLGITNAVGVTATGRGRDGTTCIVVSTGEVWCFGSDASGQVSGAARSATPVFTPTRVEGVRAKSVTLTNTFVLSIGTDDRLWSWGANDARQLARTTSEPDAGPWGAAAPADRISAAVRACAGTSATGFAVDESGDLLSWGGGTEEQLGRTTSVARDPIPATIGLSGVSRVATGASHACAVSQGRAFCWGANEQGQLGTGSKAAEIFPVPALLPAGAYAVAVFAGGASSCAIVADGDVYCWGANAGGPFGADPLAQALPRKIDGLGGLPVEVAVMDDAVCALTRNGAVACWGDNLFGQLGRGSRDIEENPIPEAVVFAP